MFTPEPIPEDQRHPKLKDYLKKWAQEVALAKRAHPEIFEGVTNGFYFLSFYWLTPAEHHSPAYEAQILKIVEASGFDGERIRNELEEILSEDNHLKECCETSLNLAYYLRDFLFTVVSWIEEKKLTDESFEKLFSVFSELTYSQPFRKFTLSHLYNFDATEQILRFDGIQIMRLEASEIPGVIGDLSVYNFLHNHRTGDYFAITESTGGVANVFDWLFSERAIALNLVDILKYYKDGVVHIDYTTPYFLPEWVNEFRKRELVFAGEPRRNTYADGSKFYRLSQAEAAEVNRWWLLYQTPQIETRLENFNHNLRQALFRAGDFYERSMALTDPVNRLIYLAIALEALYSPPTNTELNYRIGLYASFLISDNAAERIGNLAFIKAMYKRRSELFHGTYNTDRYQEGNFVTDDEAERLAGIIRASILRFLILYLKGEDNRNNILDRLANGVLDARIMDELRAESAPKPFIDQFAENLIR